MMIFNKKTNLIILISVFLLFLCLSTVCASDITVTNVNNDNNIEDYSMNQIEEVQVNDSLSESFTNENTKLNLASNSSKSNENKTINPTSFKSLNETIHNAKSNTIILDKDYKYSGKDDLSDCIIVKSNTIIDGQGHTIDCAGFALKKLILTGSDDYSDMSAEDLNLFNVAENVTIKNLILKNTHSEAGGAIYWNGTNGVITNCTFINSTTNFNGGAIYWIGANGTVINCTFQNNTANRSGGAIYSVGNVTISNSTFKNNNAKWEGGAIYASGKVTITDSTFQDTTAEEYGGAIWLNGDVTISNSTFNHNTANHSGGAISASGKVTITDSTFQNNTANGIGGAIYLDKKEITISNNIFNHNTAKWGGAIFCSDSTGNVINCTFIHCNSSEDHKAIDKFRSNITVRNCTQDNKSIEKDNFTTFFFVECPTKFINATKGTIHNGETYSVRLIDNSGIAIASHNVTINIADKNYNITTDKNGLAKVKLALNSKYLNKALTVTYTFNTCDLTNQSLSESILWSPYSTRGTSKIKVIKTPTLINAKKVSYKKRANKYFTVTVKNKLTKKVVKNLPLKIKVFTGKKSKTYTIKTNNKGVGQLPTKSLAKGTHKITIGTNNKYYDIKLSGNLIIIK